MLKQRAVWFDWPFGPDKGKTVRFFEMVGPFTLSRFGDEWRVVDSRKSNHRGGPAFSVRFNNLNDAITFMNENL